MADIVEDKTRLKKRRASPQTITPERVEAFFSAEDRIGLIQRAVECRSA